MRSRFPFVRLAMFAALALVASSGDSALSSRKPEELFKPFRGERATLSQDGSHLAFVSHEGRRLRVVILDLSKGGERADVSIEERSAAEVTFFAWTSPAMLVLASNASAIYSVDVASHTSKRVLDASLFAAASERLTVPRPPRIVGRVIGEPDSVWVEGVSLANEAAFDEEDEIPFGEPSERLTEEPAVENPVPAAGDTGGVRTSTQSMLDRHLKETELAKLNVRTGTWTSAVTVLDNRNSVYLYDRNGHARVKYLQGGKRQVFFHRPPKTGSIEPRWTELEKMRGSDAALGFHVTPEAFAGRRSFPVALDGDGSALYYASNVGRENYGLFALDTRTGRRREIAVPQSECDLFDIDRPFSTSPLVFDRANGQLVGVRESCLERRTHWLEPEIDAVQKAVETRFPRRTVEILEWDDARRRFLISVEAENDPGRLFVFHLDDGRCMECLRRAPWLEPSEFNRAHPVAFVSKEGLQLTGRLTLPRSTLISPPPAVIWLHDGPWRRVTQGYGREAQALADLGCIALQLDYRGSAGLGVKLSSALDRQFDRLPLADVEAALQWLFEQHPFDRKRVAIAGEGFGGYLALRALQIMPDRFRCAVSISAPMSLDQLHEKDPGFRERENARYVREVARFEEAIRQWNPGAGEKGRRLPFEFSEPVDFRLELNRWYFGRGAVADRGGSVLKDAKIIRHPVLLLHDPRGRISIEPVRSLRKALVRRGLEANVVEIPSEYADGALAARAQVFSAVAEFLNQALYRYDVRVGDPKIRD